MYGGDERCIHGFRWEDLSEGDHLEDREVDGKMIHMHHQEFGWRGTDWIDLAQDRDRWGALVNAVMSNRVP
jgi:hypothetical protein